MDRERERAEYQDRQDRISWFWVGWLCCSGAITVMYLTFRAVLDGVTR